MWKITISGTLNFFPHNLPLLLGTSFTTKPFSSMNHFLILKIKPSLVPFISNYVVGIRRNKSIAIIISDRWKKKLVKTASRLNKGKYLRSKPSAGGSMPGISSLVRNIIGEVQSAFLVSFEPDTWGSLVFDVC